MISPRRVLLEKFIPLCLEKYTCIDLYTTFAAHLLIIFKDNYEGHEYVMFKTCAVLCYDDVPRASHIAWKCLYKLEITIILEAEERRKKKHNKIYTVLNENYKKYWQKIDWKNYLPTVWDLQWEKLNCSRLENWRLRSIRIRKLLVCMPQ